MPAIDLQFGSMDISTSQSQEQDLDSHSSHIPLHGGKKMATSSNTKDTFWTRQSSKFKQDVLVSGTWYNLCTFALVAFVGTFLIFVLLRPPLVMTTPLPTEETPHPVPSLSWMSVFVWSLLMASVVFAIAFFTRPKPNVAYVLEK